MNRISTVDIGGYGEVRAGTDESRRPVYVTLPVFIQQALGRDPAIVLDTLRYDGASGVLQSGPNGSLPAGYAVALLGRNSDLSGAPTTV